ncbi:MAG: flagellar motor switch protein FliM [Erysipelotrichaceae bacterium]|nr:flagellar motor switch protein FliM [Erysipelotrichaceae bacterium]
MAEVLSQKEIDALLKAIKTGEISTEFQKDTDDAKVKVYDFKRPNKLSKDHISTLHMIYENYARIVSSYLTGQLRTSVAVSLITVEQLTYEEFIHALSSPTILCTLNLKEISGRFFMEISPSFGFQVVDLLCGGAAKDTERRNELTDIELSVVKEVVDTLAWCMKSSWEEIVEVNPEIESVEKNPPLEQSIAPNESVAVVYLKTFIAGKAGLINLCIPYVSLESVIQKLSVHSWFEHDKIRDGETNSMLIEKKLRNVSAELSVELGRTHLHIRDFIQLVEGDVIRLDQKIEDPVKIYVEDKLKFSGYIGTSKKKLALKISDIECDIEEERFSNE